MSIEQQDTREQQIDALGLAIYAEKRLADRYRDTTTRVYDEAVARMIADAEQAAERRALYQHDLANGGCVPKPAYDELLRAHRSHSNGVRKCDWSECPGYPESQPVHEVEQGPEFHAQCKRVVLGLVVNAEVSL